MMLLCTACSHPLAEHDDEDGCTDLDFGPPEYQRTCECVDPCYCPIECACERTALDQLYETVAERDVALIALRWYADTKNYDDNFTPGTLVGGGWAGTEPQDADWDPDYGERARKVLGLPEPWETT